MKMMTQKDLFKALIQNYGFKTVKADKLPTVDYVYPDYTADGNTENFRFSSNLRRELRERASVVTTNLHSKEFIAWTHSDAILNEVASIAPRLGIEEQLSGKINSIYYNPILFIGANSSDASISAYTVKPVIDGSMAWFEFAEQERLAVDANLRRKAEEKPYRGLFARLFDRNDNNQSIWPMMPMG